jgi:hypothetical protein
MKWQLLVADLFERVSAELERALQGLTVDDLNLRKSAKSNSIGWLAWHLTRSQDRAIEDLSGGEQLWIKDHWHLRFNRAPDPAETGFQHSPEDVEAFQSPDAETLLAYHRATLDQTKRYIHSTLSEADLDREFENPDFSHVPTVRARLVGVLNEGFQHVGQIAYIRGLVQSANHPR